MRSKAILATVTAQEGGGVDGGGRDWGYAYGKCRKMASKSAAKRQRKLKIAIVTMLTICRRQPSGKEEEGRMSLKQAARQADGWQRLHLQLQFQLRHRIQLQLQLGEQGDTYNQYEIYAIFIAANGSFLVLTFLANNAGSVSRCKCKCVCVFVWGGGYCRKC